MELLSFFKKLIAFSNTGYHPSQFSNEDLPDDGNGDYQNAEADLKEEMRRVAKTIILAMRSEADIFSEIALEEL